MEERLETEVAGLPLDPPDSPTQELIRRLWRYLSPLTYHQIIYESQLAESVRLFEILHPQVTTGDETTRFWVDHSPYVNAVWEHLKSQGEGASVDQIPPPLWKRHSREIDLGLVIKDRAERRKQPLLTP